MSSSATRRLVEVSGAEALWLLASTPLGRLVYERREGVVLRPAAHLLENGRLIVRAPAPATLPDGSPEATYQADEVDPLTGAGWTVTVAGPVEAVTEPYEHAHHRRVLRGWAHGPHDSILRVLPRTVRGFRLVDRAAG